MTLATLGSAAATMHRRLARLLRIRVWLSEQLRPTEWQAMLGWAAVAGVLGALASLAFKAGAEGIHQFLTGSDAGIVESFRLVPWWARLGIPAVGGLMAGVILKLGTHVTRGQSSTDYMEAIALGDGRVPMRTSLVKTTAALFSIGSGGSIGREGPMVQLAAVLSSALGRWRSFSPPQLRLLVAAGAAAGIASAYNAPIAGAFFVAEIILGSIAMERLGPLITASVAAMLTVRSIEGAHALYEVPEFALRSPKEMIPYAGLALIVGTLAPWFLRSLRSAERRFVALGLPVMWRLALGGLLVGALAVQIPEVCGNGYSVVVDILHGRIEVAALVGIFVCKWLATAASFGSGAPGGVFTPSLFMGASVGFLFGTLTNLAVPGAADPGAFALVGMGGFLAAATHAPVMAVIMLFEMTLSYDIILPLMLTSVVAYFTARSIESQSLYSEGLRRKTAQESTSSELPSSVAALAKPNPPTILEDAPFATVAKQFLVMRVNNLYVTDADGKFRGVVALHDIKPYLGEVDTMRAIQVRDILQEEFPRLVDDQPIGEALTKFATFDVERLPVLTQDGRLQGSLSKTDLLLSLGAALRPAPPAKQAP